MVAYVLAVHALAWLALLTPLDVHWYVRLILAALVGASLAYQLYRRAGGARTVIVRMIHSTGGDWRLTDDTGLEFRATLRAGSYVSHWLIVLRFACQDRSNCNIALFPDSLDRSAMRRLRARMRLTTPGGK